MYDQPTSTTSDDREAARGADTPSSAAQDRILQLKASLRGMTFDEGERALAPDEGPPATSAAAAPVQMAKPDKAMAAKLQQGAVKKKGGALKPGDRAGGFAFGNREGKLPDKDKGGKPITYTEFDVNAKKAGKGRDAERVVAGSDGRIWYTGDHYNSFTEV